MSFISGSIGAIKGADAQKEANKRNQQTAAQANQTNFLLNMAARGGQIPTEGIRGLNIPESMRGKEAALLPYYFDDRERALADYSGQVFDATGQLLGTPLEQGQRAQGIVDEYLPILDQARGTVAGIYDNTLTAEELGYQQPVAESRIKLAGAKRDAGLDALQETLNSIKAIQSRRGFTGDSLQANRLGFDARRKAYGEAAVDLSGAELTNAMERRSIQQGGINRKLTSTGLPTSLAQARLNLEEQPAEQVSQSFNRRLQPFQFFRMGQNNFQAQQLPQVGPNASGWQIASNSIASAGQAAGNYFAGGDYFKSKPTQYGAVNDPNYGTYGSRTQQQQANFNTASDYYEGQPSGYNANYGNYGSGAGGSAFADFDYQFGTGQG